FGHSMGSMITRSYAAVYGNGMDGLVLCGTSGEFPTAKKMVSILQEKIDAGMGEAVEPDYVDQLMGWMTERIDNPNTPNDWISIDPDVVNEHANDHLNNFTSSTNIQSFTNYTLIMKYIILLVITITVTSSILTELFAV